MAYDVALREVKAYLRTKCKYEVNGRKVIASVSEADGYGKIKNEKVMYRNGLKVFIAKDGQPVATGKTISECARKAFIDGQITDSDYVLFTHGYDASKKYQRDKSRRETRR